MVLSPIQVAGKWRIQPRAETVTYYVAISGVGFAAGVSVDGAERCDISVTERAVEGFSLTDNIDNWHLWAQQLGSIVPKPGDKIVDAAGTKWLVIGVPRLRMLKQIYHCLASKGR
jgi:hypothetical protein